MRLIAVFALLCFGLIPVSGDEPPLTLGNLLVSVDARYPSVVAALEKKAASEGKAMSARGAFDLKLKFKSRNDPLGFYENRVMEVLLEQPTRYRGSRFFGGWRRGDGLFPFQEEKLETQSGGEVVIGVSTPLLRDGAIDEARTDILRADLGVEAEESRVARVRLLVQQSAVAQLLKWQASSRKRAVRESLLGLALVRDQAIRDQANLGDKAQVDVIDNQRLIAMRREGLLAARQKESEEAVNLSLYWRDEEGNPRVPATSPETNILTVTLLGERPPMGEALAKHPEVVIFSRALQSQRVTWQLSKNQLLPQLDLALSVSQDLGTGSKTKDETEFRIGALFEYPFQNRKARGKLETARATIAAIEEELRLLTDQLRASALVADNNIRRIIERLDQLLQRLDLARQMWKAESDRVELQLSDLLRLNLREQDLAAAETDLIDAQLELRLAELDWINALAVDLAPDAGTSSVSILR